MKKRYPQLSLGRRYNLLSVGSVNDTESALFRVKAWCHESDMPLAKPVKTLRIYVTSHPQCPTQSYKKWTLFKISLEIMNYYILNATLVIIALNYYHHWPAGSHGCCREDNPHLIGDEKFCHCDVLSVPLKQISHGGWNQLSQSNNDAIPEAYRDHVIITLPSISFSCGVTQHKAFIIVSVS